MDYLFYVFTCLFVILGTTAKVWADVWGEGAEGQHGGNLVIVLGVSMALTGTINGVVQTKTEYIIAFPICVVALMLSLVINVVIKKMRTLHLKRKAS